MTTKADELSVLSSPVDLIMSGAVRNPFVRAGIERPRQLLYEA
jgi:hypothetical protein